MITQSQLKLINQGKYKYIYVYYKHRDRIIRINTGNRVVPSSLNKDLTYNTRMENHTELNKNTLELKRKVDDYIRHKINIGLIDRISQKECLRYVEEGKDSLRFSSKYFKKKEKSINDHLDDFYEFKKEELNNRPSYKDYLTFINSLKDYQKYRKIHLSFEKMNDRGFMVKYRNFLTEKRGKEYLTRGGLNDNTINKRFACLKTFFKWCEEKEYYTFKSVVQNFSAPKYDNEIVALSKEDISELLDLDIKNQTLERIRDVFVCNCFLGLRISDLKTLERSDFIEDNDGDYILIKENKKTKVKVEIPIVNTPLEILKKYDFDLPKYSNQFFNRKLNDLLELYDLFSEPVNRKRRVNKEVQDEMVSRRSLISSHTCRRTFITLGISNGIPINTLMLSTGHKQIQTIQKYMKKVQDKESFKGIDL